MELLLCSTAPPPKMKIPDPLTSNIPSEVQHDMQGRFNVRAKRISLLVLSLRAVGISLLVLRKEYGKYNPYKIPI